MYLIKFSIVTHFLFQSQTSETVKELKLRQNYENRVKELQKQIDAKEKEMESILFQYSNAKEQIKLFESTINEQKVSKYWNLRKYSR